MHEEIPLSLYVHIPWCQKKCPYCDFNSHTIATNLPEARYVESLIKDPTKLMSLMKKKNFLGTSLKSVRVKVRVGWVLVVLVLGQKSGRKASQGRGRP